MSPDSPVPYALTRAAKAALDGKPYCGRCRRATCKCPAGPRCTVPRARPRRGAPTAWGYDPFASLTLRVVARDAFADGDVDTFLECVRRGRAQGMGLADMERAWGIGENQIGTWIRRYG